MSTIPSVQQNQENTLDSAVTHNVSSDSTSTYTEATTLHQQSNIPKAENSTINIEDDDTKTSPKTGDGKTATKEYSFKDAAFEVLKQAGTCLSAKEITKRILESGMARSTGKTPDRTVAALIYSEIQKKGNGTPFILASKGLFGLRDFSAETISAAGGEADVSSTPAKKRKTEKKIDGDLENKRKRSRKSETNIFLEALESEHSETSESDSDVRRKTPKPKTFGEKIREQALAKMGRNKVSDGFKKPTKKDPYNDDYGYLYLRYYLEVTKRQEQHDLTSENDCFICKNGGELVCCDVPDCSKVYHLSCLGLDRLPEGKFYCPLHFCQECKRQGKNQAAAEHHCLTCTTAFCDEHLNNKLYKVKQKGVIICEDCLPYFSNEIGME